MARRARRSTALAPRRRSSGTFRVQRSAKGGPSPQAIKNRARTRFLALGGATAAAFGLLQSKVPLPSLPGLPDSLSYGAAGIAVGLLTGSDALLSCAAGPFFAGLHNVSLHGVGQTWETHVGGEFPDVAGEFDEIGADDFRDL